MRQEIAHWFRSELTDIKNTLSMIPPNLADVPWREGGWTRKQLIGHLIDSAANNRQRFVRASTAGEYFGPDYAQDDWVAAHGYAKKPWEALLQWWTIEHDILMAVVDQISSPQLEVTCHIGNDEPVTLQFLIEDYVRHQRWHLAQLRAGLE